MEALANADPNLFLRKIDIDTWDSPVAQAHGIESIPHLVLYENGRETMSGYADVMHAILR